MIGITLPWRLAPLAGRFGEVTITVLRPISAAVPQAAGALDRGGRSLVALLAGVVALPLLLLAGAAWHGWTLAWQDAETEMLRAADGAAEYLQRVLDGHDLRIQRANDAIADLTDAEIRAAEQRLHGQFARIAGQEPDGSGPLTLFAFDRDARALVGATAFPVPQDQSFADRDFNQALRDPTTAEPYVSQVHIGRLDGRAFFAVGRRRRDSANPPAADGFDGVIVVSLYVDGAAAALRRLGRGPADVISVIRTDGTVLVRSIDSAASPPARRIGADSPLLPLMAAGRDRVVLFGRSSIDGVRRVMAFRRLEGWPVYAAAARSDSAVVARWWRGFVGQLAVGLPAWALLLGTATGVWRRQRALGEANSGLERRVAARTAELAESEAQLRLAQEAAGVGIWEWNLATDQIRWSAEQYALFGLPPAPSGSVAFAQVLQLIHPAERAEVEAAARAAITTGTYESEFRILRPSAQGEETRWLLGRGRRMPGRGGQGSRLSGVTVVITARRLAEERRELVAREVAHRAKNALQLVGAAVRMTRAVDTTEFIRLVEGRVAALARAQTLLAEAGGRGADLYSLAASEIGSVLSDERGGPSVALDGPPLEVAEAAVQPLSMALHELATNAAKYGGLSVSGGGVALSWVVDDGAGLLRLRWAEHGGPAPVGEPTKEGFGTRVLEATLAAQLGGTIRRAWPATGLVLEAELPLIRIRAT